MYMQRSLLGRSEYFSDEGEAQSGEAQVYLTRAKLEDISDDGRARVYLSRPRVKPEDNENESRLE